MHINQTGTLRVLVLPETYTLLIMATKSKAIQKLEKDIKDAKKSLADDRSIVIGNETERPHDFVEKSKETRTSVSKVEGSNIEIKPVADRTKGWASAKDAESIKFRLSVTNLKLFTASFDNLKALQALLLDKELLAKKS